MIGRTRYDTTGVQYSTLTLSNVSVGTVIETPDGRHYRISDTYVDANGTPRARLRAPNTVELFPSVDDVQSWVNDGEWRAYSG